MASNYTEEKLNSLDKETLIQLFLSQQKQLEQIDHTLQLVLEQMADLKRHRFGRSSEKHETEEQLSFMEVDGKIVFFNELEAVAAEEAGEEPETVLSRKPKKKQGKAGRGSRGTASSRGRTFHDGRGTGGQVRQGRLETASG